MTKTMKAATHRVKMRKKNTKLYEADYEAVDNVKEF